MYIDQYEVIVIGGGASGIGAAVTLRQHNIPYIVLEGRDRIGGRVYSESIDGVEMDLGACWVHSCSQSNPVYQWVQKLNWKPSKLSKFQIGRKIVDGWSGEQFEEETTEMAHYHYRRFFDISEKKGQTNPELSVYQAAQEYYQTVIMKLPPSEKRLIDLLINMTEHYEASSTKELSCNYDESTDTGGDFPPQHSYYKLLLTIAEGLNIRLNTKVTEIHYGGNMSEVVCQGGLVFRAPKVVCGLPLGILKNRMVKFSPQLPMRHQKAIQNLGNGVMNKVIMAFTEKFWGNCCWMSIGCDERGKFPHFYNFSQGDKYILCCFITDDFARKIQNWNDEAIINQLLLLLKTTHKGKNVELKQYRITRWKQDPFSMGSYSAFHVGSSPDDCVELRKSVNHRLWMVGEHCYFEHIGTAHGAFQTGIWAAQDIVKKCYNK